MSLISGVYADGRCHVPGPNSKERQVAFLDHNLDPVLVDSQVHLGRTFAGLVAQLARRHQSPFHRRENLYTYDGRIGHTEVDRHIDCIS